MDVIHKSNDCRFSFIIFGDFFLHIFSCALSLVSSRFLWNANYVCLCFCIELLLSGYQIHWIPVHLSYSTAAFNNKVVRSCFLNGNGSSNSASSVTPIRHHHNRCIFVTISGAVCVCTHGCARSHIGIGYISSQMLACLLLLCSLIAQIHGMSALLITFHFCAYTRTHARMNVISGGNSLSYHIFCCGFLYIFQCLFWFCCCCATVLFSMLLLLFAGVHILVKQWDIIEYRTFKSILPCIFIQSNKIDITNIWLFVLCWNEILE